MKAGTQERAKYRTSALGPQRIFGTWHPSILRGNPFLLGGVNFSQDIPKTMRTTCSPISPTGSWYTLCDKSNFPPSRCPQLWRQRPEPRRPEWLPGFSTRCGAPVSQVQLSQAPANESQGLPDYINKNQFALQTPFYPVHILHLGWFISPFFGRLIPRMSAKPTSFALHVGWSTKTEPPTSDLYMQTHEQMITNV